MLQERSRPKDHPELDDSLKLKLERRIVMKKIYGL